MGCFPLARYQCWLVPIWTFPSILQPLTTPICAERLSSSVLRQITYQLRNSDEIKQLLGDRVHYAKNWYGK